MKKGNYEQRRKLIDLYSLEEKKNWGRDIKFLSY